MTMDRAYIEHLYLLASFLAFYVLNVVNSFSDWTPNGEFLGIHKSSVNQKGPPNTSPLKMLTNLYNPQAYIGDFTVLQLLPQEEQILWKKSNGHSTARTLNISKKKPHLFKSDDSLNEECSSKVSNKSDNSRSSL